ncbi:MAG: DUF6502 family protein [Steroidobacteraceae bacterium]
MSSDEIGSHLRYALRRVLRLVTRLLIRAGIRFNEFVELARGVYVETAIRDRIETPELPSRARIAGVTGLTRRQVDGYIDNEGALPLADPAHMAIAAVAIEVLHKWHSTPEYAGPYGIPLELEFETPPDRCIRSLVAAVMPKADPRIALEELLRIGAIAPSGDKHFRAVSRSFVRPLAQLIEHFGRTLSRLAATLEYNMDPRYIAKRLERNVAVDQGLPAELVPEFEKFARNRAVEFLVELDNWLAQYRSDDTEDTDRVETGVNVFLYADLRKPELPPASLFAIPSDSRNI